MDPRLLPVNAIVALLTDDQSWPSVLFDQGFRRHRLEAPVTVKEPSGRVVVDKIFYRRNPDVVIPCEGKSGANVEETQAQRYGGIDAYLLRRSGFLPPGFDDTATVAPMFVGLTQHRDRLSLGLEEAGVAAAILTFDETQIRLENDVQIPGLESFNIQHDLGLPPPRIPIDHQSPDGEVAELLVQQMVAAAASGAEFIELERLCALMLPEWALLARVTQTQFLRKAESVARGLCADELGSDFAFEPNTQGGNSRLRVLKNPSGMAPQGRTQAWQAQSRRTSNSLGRAGPKVPEGQMTIDDLAEEGGLADG